MASADNKISKLLSSVHEPLPKTDIPDELHNPDLAFQYIRDELMLDGNAKQNLATFCQTHLEPQVKELMTLAIDKNMVDRDEYPQTAVIEKRCVTMLSNLWHAPGEQIGTSTTGSSEAAMLGGLSLLFRWRKNREANNLPADKPNIVTGPVQVCWHKFARYWGVELREIPMEQDRLILTPEEAVKRCDENTIAVVPTLGVTFTGEFEPVQALAAALDDYQVKTGLDIPIHVDAASGGFIAPFIYPDLVWDFRLERVKSINASGHKFGLAPLGVGWIMWRTPSDLPEDLTFQVNYLGGNMLDIALNFSRPGGQVIAQYYNFLRLGKEGYREIHSYCRDIAVYLAENIAKDDAFEIIYNGDGGIPALSWKLREDCEHSFSLFDLADRLRTRGWLVPAYALPKYRQDLVIQRILVKRGFTLDLAELLLKDLRDSIDILRRHPVSVPLSEAEAGGFKH